MSIFQLPAYRGDNRGGKVTTATLRQVDGELSDKWADLNGPTEAVDQIMQRWSGAAALIGVPEDQKATVSHSLYFWDGFPEGFRDFVHLLQEVVSIPNPAGVDCCIALDWYKVADQNVDPAEWADTPMGQCIHYTKYATNPSWSNSRLKRGQLVRTLKDFIERHPRYSAARSITAPPGSKADGQSFGEGLALEVAATTGKVFIPQTAAGPRAEQKGGLQQDLSLAFTMSQPVAGTTIVVDDVYRTGASMSGAAMAARRAGATAVLTLTAVRTMRT